MGTPTVCPVCLDVVELNDMVDVAQCGLPVFVCEDCALELEDDS